MSATTILKMRIISKILFCCNCLKLTKIRSDVVIGLDITESKIPLFSFFHICHKVSVTRVKSNGLSISKLKKLNECSSILANFQFYYIDYFHTFLNWLCQNWEQKIYFCSNFWFNNVPIVLVISPPCLIKLIETDNELWKSRQKKKFLFRRDLKRTYTLPNIRIDSNRRRLKNNMLIGWMMD